MLRVMFWNSKGAPEALVAKVANHELADILVLAEARKHPAPYLLALNRNPQSGFVACQTDCERISIYSRFPSDYFERLKDSRHVSIRRVNLPARPDFILVCLHLPSRLHQTPESQRTALMLLAQTVRAAEARTGISRSIIIGDFNCDPHEAGVVGAGGLHAVMSKERAQRMKRVVSDREYPFLYNPMWSYLGDLSEGPPGTYHYAHSEYVELFWHCFDQVLLSPSMLEYMRKDSVRVITRVEGVDLADAKGYPNHERASDHFPLLLTLHV